MRKLIFMTILVFSFTLLAACSGPPASEPAVNITDSTGESETVTQEEDTATEPMEEPMEEEPEAETAVAAPIEEAETVEETEGATGFGDMLMSGIDPETGLEINPDVVGPGDTFIVRGIVISMNLTPVTEPEFLIQAPSGTKYRMRTQALADMFFNDGSQWQAFEFRQGVGATATVTLDTSASLSDVARSEDMVLIMVE